VEGFVSVEHRRFKGIGDVPLEVSPKERGRPGTIDCILVMDGGAWFIDALLNTGDTPR